MLYSSKQIEKYKFNKVNKTSENMEVWLRKYIILIFSNSSVSLNTDFRIKIGMKVGWTTGQLWSKEMQLQCWKVTPPNTHTIQRMRWGKCSGEIRLVLRMSDCCSKVKGANLSPVLIPLVQLLEFLTVEMSNCFSVIQFMLIMFSH